MPKFKKSGSSHWNQNEIHKINWNSEKPEDNNLHKKSVSVLICDINLASQHSNN